MECTPDRLLSNVNGTIRTTLRPVRVASVIPYGDDEALLHAMQMGTFMWGGLLNPIIPYVRRLPISWERDPHFRKRETTRGILAGYIANYDPDCIAVADAIPSADVDSLSEGRQVIKLSAMIKEMGANNKMLAGLGFFDLAQHIFNMEFKYVRNHPLRVGIPANPRNLRHYWTCVFGGFVPSVEQAAKSALRKGLNAQTLPCRLDGFLNVLRSGPMPPIRLTAYDLTMTRRQVWDLNPKVHLMDATNWLDIVDYWNLRAASWHALPLPLQALRSPHVLDQLAELAGRVSKPHPYVKGDRIRMQLIRGRSLSDQEWSKSTESIAQRLVLLCYVTSTGGGVNRVLQQGQCPTNRTSHG